MRFDEAYQHQIIRASAGSGKTFKLSERYLKLILEGAPLETILATTFTRKAAGEIQDRILKRLGEGALSLDGAKKLSHELTYSYDAISQDEFAATTIRIARSINRLRICTLDSFFMQLARGYAFELGLPPGWTIVEESRDNASLRHAIQSTFYQTNDGKNARAIAKLLFKGELKKSIEEQVYDLTKAALSLYRESSKQDWFPYKDIIADDVPDVEDCVAALAAAELPKTKTGTPRYHYKNSRNLLKHDLQEGDWEDALKEGLLARVLDGSYFFDKVNIEGSLKDALELTAKLVKNKILTSWANQLKACWSVLDAISHYYEGIKASEGAYRFDDLSKRLSKFIYTGDALEHAEYRLDAQTRHLLLDEFQDASYEQWLVVRPFALAITSRENADLDRIDPDFPRKLATFFCVGDVKQAIYGWRGGVAEIFRAIETELPNVELKGMTKNWRSSPVIIRVVNKLFETIDQNPVFNRPLESNEGIAERQKKVAAREAVERWRRNFEKHEWAEKNDALDGYWALELAPEFALDQGLSVCAGKAIVDAKTRREIEPADPSIVFRNADLEDEESEDADDDGITGNGENQKNKSQKKNIRLAYAARRVKNLRARYPRASIGVLARSNDVLAKMLLFLKRLGVEASNEGGATIVDTPSVDAITALFRLAAHPGDSVDAFCVANVKPLAQALMLDPEAINSSSCRRASDYLRTVIETKGFGKFSSDVRDLLVAECVDSRQKERMDQFVEFAYSYQAATPSSSLDDFVDAVGAFKTQTPSETAVRVMTIHGSKGLEFDIVVLPDLESNFGNLSGKKFIAGRKSPLAPIEAVMNYVGQDMRGLLPERLLKYFQDELARAIEEALCLLYVAVTRPRRMLLAIIDRNASKKASKKDSLTMSYNAILRGGLPPRELMNNLPGEDSDIYSNPLRIFEEGDRDWGADLKRPRDAGRELDSEIKDERPVFRRDDRSRLIPRRQSPTDSHKTRAWKRPEIFIRGKCIHACYERIGWLDVDGRPDENELRRVLPPLANFDRAQMERAIADFYKMCDSEFTRLLMSRATYEKVETTPRRFFEVAPCAVAGINRLAAPRLELRREFNYRVLKGNALQIGTIDRLVLLYDGNRLLAADVVDFKTDVRMPAHALLDEYLEQLKLYGEAVESLFKLPRDKISLRLAFVTLETLVDARSGATQFFGAAPNN